MGKITDYSAATRFDANDVLLKDGTGGTKKILVADAATEFAGLVSAMQHRNVFRGKNLGTSVTAAQKAAIQNATFDDLFIGDYWVINGVNWTIADMDYWYQTGDTAFTRHHLVIIPAGKLYDAKMNDSNTTEGGYYGSKMRGGEDGVASGNLGQALTAFQNAFGDMLLTHREYLTNAVTDGHPSAGAWYDSTIDLMNEIMVYGCHIHAPANDGVMLPTRYTINKQQLSLFRLNPKAINNRQYIWLRDVVTAAYFALVGTGGNAASGGASGSSGVRPVGAIG